MSTIKVTNLKHESSSSDNITLDSSANTTIGGNLIAQAGSASTPAIQATGDANTGIYFSGADAVDVATGGTQALQLDSSQNLKFNSGYGSVATAYGVRAWVNFDGTQVTNPGSTTGIRASGNCSSITDVSVGQYQFNFATAMPDANYAAVSEVKISPSDAENTRIANTTYSTTQFEIEVTNAGNAAFRDSDLVNIIVVR